MSYEGVPGVIETVEAHGETTLVVDPARLVEACTACRGYAKVVDVSASLPFPLVAIADLETMDLDMAAMQHGFSRPAMKTFARGQGTRRPA